MLHKNNPSKHDPEQKERKIDRTRISVYPNYNSLQFYKNIFNDVRKFINIVVSGNQNTAETFLTSIENQKQLSIILSKKTSVTDNSGRQFRELTAFQYALWALDIGMWQMMLKYIPSEVAKTQIIDLEKNGVYYKKADGIIVKGEEIFDYSVLLYVYDEYCRGHYDSYPRDAYDLWKKIAKEQRMVPAHFANFFCGNQSHHFSYITENNDKQRVVDWYEYPYGKFSGIGCVGSMGPPKIWRCMNDHDSLMHLAKSNHENYLKLKMEQLHLVESIPTQKPDSIRPK